MGEADPKIEFRCKYCGRKFSVPQIHAGKKGKCPKCKNLVIVPKLESTSSTSRRSDSEDSKINSKHSAYDLALLDVPQKDKIQDQLISQSTAPEKAAEYGRELQEEPAVGKTEPVGERKLPWLFDVLIYPSSKGGLTTLAIIILLKLLTDIAAVVLACCFCGGILGLIVRIVIVYSYLYWYFSECIRDSAAGGLRAPETIGSMPGLADMFWQWARLFACYALFLGPLTFYRGYTFFYSIETNSVIFWSLLTYGIFFFPMGILAVVMFDSVNGLNPVLLIRSIVSTLVKYCGLVVLFYGLGVLFVILLAMMVSILPKSGIISYIFVAYISFNIFYIYALLIVGHLLGRFYWRYEDKLYWEV